MTKYVISAGYDSGQNAVFLKLYDDKTEKLEEWFEPNYKSYCLSDNIESFNGMGVTNITTVTKYDALNDSTVVMHKGTFKLPSDIKRTHINDDEFDESLPKFWENHLKIQMSYIYDEDINRFFINNTF